MVKLTAKRLDSIPQKAMGLLGSKVARTVYFKTRFGIHTFFMRYPIDLIVLDRQNKVRVLKQKVLPNRVVLWSPKFQSVLELPAGTIEKNGIKVGDTISLEFES